MPNESIKLRGSIGYGPVMMTGSSWPFGGIEIYRDKIIFSNFIFSKTIVDKSAFESIAKTSMLFNSIRFVYKRDEAKKTIYFSTLMRDDLVDVLQRCGYVVS